MVFVEIFFSILALLSFAVRDSALFNISKNIKCKTLFSTHYHELTALEEKLEKDKKSSG